MKLLFYIFTFFILTLNFVSADTIKIDFTTDDSHSIEVTKIDLGGTVE